MLAIHSERDYRVPIGEGHRLCSEPAEHHAADAGSMPHGYRVVLAFLQQHVLGAERERPKLLG